MQRSEYIRIFWLHDKIRKHQLNRHCEIENLPCISEMTQADVEFYERWANDCAGKRHDPKSTTTAQDEAYFDRIRQTKWDIDIPDPRLKPRKPSPPKWWEYPQFPEHKLAHPKNQMVLPCFGAMAESMRNAIKHLIIKDSVKEWGRGWEMGNRQVIHVDNKISGVDTDIRYLIPDGIFKGCAGNGVVYHFKITRFGEGMPSRTDIFMWLSEPRESRYYPNSLNANFWACTNGIFGGGSTNDGCLNQENNLRIIAELLPEKPFSMMDDPPFTDEYDPSKPLYHSISFKELRKLSNYYPRMNAECFYTTARKLWEKAREGYVESYMIEEPARRVA